MLFATIPQNIDVVFAIYLVVYDYVVYIYIIGLLCDIVLCLKLSTSLWLVTISLGF